MVTLALSHWTLSSAPHASQFASFYPFRGFSSVPAQFSLFPLFLPEHRSHHPATAPAKAQESESTVLPILNSFPSTTGHALPHHFPSVLISQRARTDPSVEMSSPPSVHPSRPVQASLGRGGLVSCLTPPLTQTGLMTHYPDSSSKLWYESPA